MSLADKKHLVQELESRARVFISSEKELPEELEPYRISIRPEDMHAVLDAAALYVGEGASMASECAMLATPAIYINSLDAGTLKEQTSSGLIYSFRTFDGVIDLALSIMDDSDMAADHLLMRDQMLQEKIDVTALLVGISESMLADKALEAQLFTKLNFKLA